MQSVTQVFERAVQDHDAGNLCQAEIGCRQILQWDPGHFNALHLLGVIAHRAGRDDRAVEHIEQALILQPLFPEAYNNLGIVLSGQGKLAQAVASFQRALVLRPNFAEVFVNLGNALKEQGKLDEAIGSYRRAVHLRPELAAAHNNLGMALAIQGRRAEAAACYRQALLLRPAYAEAHNNLGLVLREQGEFEEAIASCRQALRLRPDYADAYNSLGLALREQRRLDEALACYREAIRLKPACAEAHNNLGIALRDRGMVAEAIASCREAVRLKPAFAEAYNNLGNVLKDVGEVEEAIAVFRQALAWQPACAEVHMNLGNALRDRGELDESRASYERALRLKPDLATAYNNLGSLLRLQGRLDGALAAFRAALTLEPGAASFHDNLVFSLHCHPDLDAAALCREARLWNEQHAAPLARFHQPHVNSADPARRLRVGYVSADFRNHALSYVLMPLLANHDHREVEIFCYAEVVRPDETTQRVRAYADVWRATVGLTDAEMADMVRADGIDILVDLALHTANNRLLVFARKPAPIQVTWLGYPGTTGLTAIDYRLTDPYFDPPDGEGANSSEEPIRLPDTFWCYEPASDEPTASTLPAYENGLLTLGCLNNFSKINDRTLALWAKLLCAIPQARLMLYAPAGSVREEAWAKFQQQKVPPARVQFIDRQTRPEYMKSFSRFDLCLDPWPCNGGVTSLNALWMGVPIITLVGDTLAGRAGWSLLSNLGLQELAAQTEDEYIAIAMELAADLPRLQELRAGLRARLCASPLMDGPRFARNVEQAYRQMWRKWCESS